MARIGVRRERVGFSDAQIIFLAAVALAAAMAITVWGMPEIRLSGDEIDDLRDSVENDNRAPRPCEACVGTGIHITEALNYLFEYGWEAFEIRGEGLPHGGWSCWECGGSGSKDLR